MNGTFAIYPTVDIDNAKEHAVVFCDDIDVAGELCTLFSLTTGLPHSAVLRMPSWSDPLLVFNLNGVENVAFSTRDPHTAHRASLVVRHAKLGHVREFSTTHIQ